MGGLAGTTWRLVEFRSSDDRIGVVRPGASAVFTMALEPGGGVSFQLDCNRGSGTWSATPTGRASGSFSFGPLDVTKAFCPPPGLDRQIARDAEFVRSFLLQDGRLYLSLLADAGIYVWEPI